MEEEATATVATAVAEEGESEVVALEQGAGADKSVAVLAMAKEVEEEEVAMGEIEEGVGSLLEVVDSAQEEAADLEAASVVVVGLRVAAGVVKGHEVVSWSWEVVVKVKGVAVKVKGVAASSSGRWAAAAKVLVEAVAVREAMRVVPVAVREAMEGMVEDGAGSTFHTGRGH